MHDILRKMLKAPVFLDSSVLRDLRNLITEGVHKSDSLVLLVTRGVFSRPWCLPCSSCSRWLARASPS